MGEVDGAERVGLRARARSPSPIAARIVTSRPKGYVPYSARLIAGLLCYRGRIPRAASVQAHRVDVGLFTRPLLRGPLVDCIHIQERGLLDLHSGPWPARADSDLVRRFTGGREGAAVNPRAVSAPTWFDAAISASQADPPIPFGVISVGRFEVPNDPELTIRAFAARVRDEPAEP